jgi:hypothetical protein
MLVLLHEMAAVCRRTTVEADFFPGYMPIEGKISY